VVRFVVVAIVSSLIFGFFAGLTSPINLYAIIILGLFWISLVLVVAAVRGISSIIRPRDYFKTKGGEYDESQVQDHVYCYKILYIVLPILVAILVSSYLDYFAFLDRFIWNVDFQKFLSSLQISLLMLLVLVFGYLMSRRAMRDYTFYFAKACVKIAQKKPSRIDKIYYLFLAIGSYNSYIQKRLGLQIRDPDLIFDNIVRASGDETSGLIGYLDKAFEGDKADVAGCLASMFLRDPTGDQLLTKNVRGNQIKDLLITIVIPITTILVSIVDLFVI
jgi:hypothetical protein